MSEQSSPFRQTVQELDEHFYSVFPLAKPQRDQDSIACFPGEAFRYDPSDETYVQAPFQPSPVLDTNPSHYNPFFPTSVQAVDASISHHHAPENQPGPSTQFLPPQTGHYTSAAHVAYSEPSTSNQVQSPQEQATHSFRPYSDINASHPTMTLSPPLQSSVDTRSPHGRVFFPVESSSFSPINELGGLRENVMGHTMANHSNSIANALQPQYPKTSEPQEPSTSLGTIASRIPQSPRQQGHSTRPVPHVASPDKVPSRGSAWLEPQAGPSTSSRQSMRLSPLPSKRQLEKKPPLACLFCRGRKIACGPPLPGSRDKTCNQCQRRSLRCEYPAESRRGMRKKKTTDSADKGTTPSSTDNAETESP